MNRRQFLAQLAALAPMSEVASLILRENFASALDSTADSFYLALDLEGAPARWMFDQWLVTKDGESILPGSPLGNILTGSSNYTGFGYSTFKYKNTHVSPIFNTDVTSPNGKRKLSGLLDHMVVIRGYGSGVDGHLQNSIKQFRPVPGVGSITGRMADFSNSLMKAVQMPGSQDAWTGYQSMKGYGVIPIFNSTYDPSNPTAVNSIKTLMNSFVRRPDRQTMNSLRDRYKNLADNFSRNVMNTSRNPAHFNGANALIKDHENAMGILGGALEDLDAIWVALYNKYQAIALGTYRDKSVPGLTDKPLVPSDDGVSASSIYNVYLSDTSIAFPAPGTDMRSWVDNAYLTEMIRSFALAEFTLTRKLSRALELGNLSPSNLMGSFARVIKPDGSKTGAQTATFHQIFDEHIGGQFTSIFMNGCFYRAFGACLLELITQLKGAGIFDRTVIHVTSEFGRMPRADASGADHAFNSMVSSIFTGATSEGPFVAGNILRDPLGAGMVGSNYPGTNGYRAPTKIGSSQILLSPTHVASTLANLLRFPENPWANLAEPLFRIRGATLEARAEAAIK